MRISVLIKPDSSVAEILDGEASIESLLDCDEVERTFPSYFDLFTDPRGASYRATHKILSTFDSHMSLVAAAHYLRGRRAINKIFTARAGQSRGQYWVLS